MPERVTSEQARRHVKYADHGGYASQPLGNACADLLDCRAALAEARAEIERLQARAAELEAGRG